MERYNNDVSVEDKPISRVAKNDSLYENIKDSELSRLKTNSNIKVIESNGKTIDIEKIKKYISESSNPQVKRRNPLIIEEKETVEEKKLEQTKEYDINSILEKAKKNREIDYERERYKKLRDTQYDILSKINIYNETNEEEKEEESDLNTEERTLVDLISTITIQRGEEDLLGDLMGGKTEEITLPIEKEREISTITKDIKPKEIEEVEEKQLPTKEEILEQTKELVKLKEKDIEVDNSFYTNSSVFSKEDFEGFEELEKSVRKNGVLTKVMLVLLVIFIIVSIVLITNYVFNLGLF